jgi:hypothetical protein
MYYIQSVYSVQRPRAIPGSGFSLVSLHSLSVDIGMTLLFELPSSPSGVKQKYRIWRAVCCSKAWPFVQNGYPSTIEPHPTGFIGHPTGFIGWYVPAWLGPLYRMALPLQLATPYGFYRTPYGVYRTVCCCMAWPFLCTVRLSLFKTSSSVFEDSRIFEYAPCNDTII